MGDASRILTAAGFLGIGIFVLCVAKLSGWSRDVPEPQSSREYTPSPSCLEYIVRVDGSDLAHCGEPGMYIADTVVFEGGLYIVCACY